MHSIPLLVLYCALVALASLAGGWLPLLVHLTHRRLQIAISFVAGLMLGIALLHFIPHATAHTHSLDRTVEWALGGFLVMFFLQRFLHYHHHDVDEGGGEDDSHHHPESEGHAHGHDLGQPSTHQLSWAGAATGLTLHSLLDGLALAAAVAAESAGHGTLLGLGTALAVVLHKPFDAMAVSTLMASSGCSRASRHLFNWLFALVAPLGVILFSLGAGRVAEENPALLGCALAFCAGTFLCISCSDLLPELQFHSHDRLQLSLALLAGLGVAVLIGQFETSGHDHPGTGPEAGAAGVTWTGHWRGA